VQKLPAIVGDSISQCQMYVMQDFVAGRASRVSRSGWVASSLWVLEGLPLKVSDLPYSCSLATCFTRFASALGFTRALPPGLQT